MTDDQARFALSRALERGDLVELVGTLRRLRSEMTRVRFGELIRGWVVPEDYRSPAREWIEVAEDRTLGDAYATLATLLSGMPIDRGLVIAALRLSVEHGGAFAIPELAVELRDRDLNAAVGFATRAVNRRVGRWWLAAEVLGTSLIERGSDVEGLAMLRAAVAEDAELAVVQARHLIELGRVSEAAVLLDDAVRRGAGNAPIALGNLLWERGDPSEAERMYRIGIERGDAHSGFNLHLLLLELDRPDDAATALRLAAAMGDERASAWRRDSVD